MEILFIIVFFVALLCFRRSEKEQTEDLIALRSGTPATRTAVAALWVLAGMALLAVLLLLAFSLPMQ